MYLATLWVQYVEKSIGRPHAVVLSATADVASWLSDLLHAYTPNGVVTSLVKHESQSYLRMDTINNNLS